MRSGVEAADWWKKKRWFLGRSGMECVARGGGEKEAVFLPHASIGVVIVVAHGIGRGSRGDCWLSCTSVSR